MTAIAPVSAIVPLFNGRRFIREAIDSILAQELKPREIVVVTTARPMAGAIY